MWLQAESRTRCPQAGTPGHAEPDPQADNEENGRQLASFVLCRCCHVSAAVEPLSPGKVHK
jgi:hypothetical protein